MAWILTSAWLVAIALMFESVPRATRPDTGAVLLAFSLAAVSALCIVVAIQIHPTSRRVIALLIGFLASLVFTWRDLRWAQGPGRHDGQAALVWLDPVVVLLVAYPAVLASIAVLRGLGSRLISRREGPRTA